MESAMNHVAALVRTCFASFHRYGKGVKLLRLGTAVALGGFLVFAGGYLTPNTAEAGSTKGGATSDQVGPAEQTVQTTTFGTLGIVEGQTARLSAVRSGDDDPARGCTVGLNFFDTQGDRQGAGLLADLKP